MYNEKYFTQDLKVLVDNPLSFFPSSKNDIIENLNAVVRFGIYASIILAAYHKKPEYIFLCVIGFVISYLMFLYYDIQLVEEFSDELDSIKNSNYTKPTLNNPMMNVLVTEYQSEDRPEAYPVTDTSKEGYLVKKDMEDKLNFNLFRDVGDIYNNKHSQREFYTMPNTTVPNNLEKYIDFVYNKDRQPICKENRFFCGNKSGNIESRNVSNGYVFTYEENYKNLR